MDLRRFLIEQTFKAPIEREIDGTLGKIIVFHYPPNHYPERFAVKTVDAARLGKRTTQDALRRFAHELRHWIRYRHHPLIITPFFTEFVQQWPYVAMPYCESNLRDYVAARPGRGTTSQAVALMIQVLEALCYAQANGLLAHQDLKPENVLLQDLRVRFDLPREYPFTWRARVADFGLANAYAELGVRWGSRPYLAPEQYDDGTDLSKCDVFACGVILHELLTGRHPIGEVTHEVWPDPAPGQSAEWRHEGKWKKWARSGNKLRHTAASSLDSLGALIESTLVSDSGKRPPIIDVETELLSYLEKYDQLAYLNLSALLDHYTSFCKESQASGDTDERYQQRYMEVLIGKQPS